jgi:hypothetical protein
VLEKNGEDQFERSGGKNGALQTVKEKSKVVHRTKRRKANWIEHILHRNNLLKHVFATKIE